MSVTLNVLMNINFTTTLLNTYGSYIVNVKEKWHKVVKNITKVQKLDAGPESEPRRSDSSLSCGSLHIWVKGGNHKSIVSTWIYRTDFKTLHLFFFDLFLEKGWEMRLTNVHKMQNVTWVNFLHEIFLFTSFMTLWYLV